MRPKPTASTFWARVCKGPGCWYWQGPLHETGYGNAAVDGVRGSHRIAWTLTNGDIPKNLCVLHRCDNRVCVNPEHLFLGTKKDNFQDMVSKGRAPLQKRPEQGALHRQAKMSEETARSIFVLRAQGLLQREIADVVGMSRGLVSGVLNGHFWKCLDVVRRA